MSNPEPVVLHDLIRNQARKNPEKTAIRFEGQSVGYGEFLVDVDRAARMLQGFGIKRGDRLGLMFPNRPEILLLYFAGFQIGAIVVPVNTRYQRPEIEYALDHSECQLLVIDKIFSAITRNIDQAVPSLERIVVHVDAAEQHFEALTALGVDVDAITEELQVEGVASFADAFSGLLAAIEAQQSNS